MPNSRVKLASFVSILSVFLVLTTPNTAVGATTTLRGGTYVDSVKSVQTWSISQAGTLVWGGSPYLPVGGAFHPQSLIDSSDAAWQVDEQALQLLKSHGITSIIVWPDKPLINIAPSAFQRLVTYLDENGFQYGVAFGPGALPRISGFNVRPAVYRFDNAQDTQAVWRIKGVDAAAYFIADAGSDSRIVQKGMARVDGDTVTAPFVTVGNITRPVVITLPHITAAPDRHMPDLWSGFDSYRDNLLTFFKSVQFGKGLRFFINPLGRYASMPSADRHIVPNSPLALVEWRHYLETHLGTSTVISNRWQLSTPIDSITVLSRLIPLWSGGRGIPYLYDPATGDTHRVETVNSASAGWWNDYTSWREGSIKYYLNSISNILKRRIADVPVVVTAMPNSLFLTQTSPEGYDGLTIATSPQQPSRLQQLTGPAYACSSWSSSPLWLMAAPIEGDNNGVLPPYPNLTSLEQDIASMRSIGFKGFYVDQFSAASDLPKSQNWLASPQLLDWLHQAKTDIDGDSQSPFVQPRALYFPESSPGPATVGLVPNSAGVYWLPCTATGKSLNLWPSFEGYSITLPDGTAETVLSSLMGPRKVRFETSTPKTFKCETPEGVPVPVQMAGKTSVVVSFNQEPLIFTIGSQSPFPDQAASDAIALLAILLKVTDPSKNPAATFARIQFDEDQQLLKAHNPAQAYKGALRQVEALSLAASPYRWIEGENPVGTNFPEYAANAGASGGGYLRLATAQSPSQVKDYASRYVFDVPTAGDYTIWMAGTPPGPGVSPIAWYIDNHAEHDPTNATPGGPKYLSGYFGWFQLGTTTLTAGAHAVTIHVLSKSKGRYFCSIDALVIAPVAVPFVPDGTEKPLPLDPKLTGMYLKAILEAKP